MRFFVFLSVFFLITVLFVGKCMYKPKQNLKIRRFVNKRYYFCSYHIKAIVYIAKEDKTVLTTSTLYIKR